MNEFFSRDDEGALVFNSLYMGGDGTYEVTPGVFPEQEDAVEVYELASPITTAQEFIQLLRDLVEEEQAEDAFVLYRYQDGHEDAILLGAIQQLERARSMQPKDFGDQQPDGSFRITNRPQSNLEHERFEEFFGEGYRYVYSRPDERKYVLTQNSAERYNVDND